MLVAEWDLKLLLAIQYVCKIAKLAVPWDDIARVMGPAITGSEILQHLATTRTRMVAIGLDVPPPLDFPRKIEKFNENTSYYFYNFDDNDEAWDVDDSDIEYGEPIAKRGKMSTEGSSKRKVHDGTDGGDHMSAEVIITGQRRLNLEDDYASHSKTDPRTLYKKGLVVSPTPTKKNAHEAVVHNCKMVVQVKSVSAHHRVNDHQGNRMDVAPLHDFLGKMKIGFVLSPTSTIKDVHQTVVQKRKVATHDKNFSGAHDWSMGNPIPYSHQPGLCERFEQLHKRYPDPNNHISWIRR